MYRVSFLLARSRSPHVSAPFVSQAEKEKEKAREERKKQHKGLYAEDEERTVRESVTDDGIRKPPPPPKVRAPSVCVVSFARFGVL